MEDNLIFFLKNQNDELKKNGRQPQTKIKTGRRPQQIKMEDDLKKIKMEDDLKKSNGKRTNQPKST